MLQMGGMMRQTIVDVQQTEELMLQMDVGKLQMNVAMLQMGEKMRQMVDEC